jgi:hypothetical protein
MSPILYWPLLLLTCGYALFRGGHYERLVALICVIGSIASVILHPLHGRYASVNAGELAVDCIVLAGFIAVALYSDRFWPLWVAGLQLTSSFAHVLKAIQPELIPHAYAAAVRFWSYPILLVLFIGAWRSNRRTQQIGTSLPA